MRNIALKTKILRLLQGYPQDWIYIEREITGDLGSNEKRGIRAPINFVGKKLSEVFRKDLMDVNARKVAIIRPIIGANGAGKTTQMEIQIKKYVKEIFQDKLIYLFFDFKYISNTIEEFWPVFVQKFYEQLQEKNYLRDLCSELPQNKLKSALIRRFRNVKIVENILYSISHDASTQARADEYFYGYNNITKKDITDFLNGFLNLALELDKLVVFCLDEVQFLIDIDPSKTLVKIILEQFIRKLVEQYRNKRLYLIISCLQNPDRKEYESLKNVSKNFKSIIEGKEIILGNLLASEKRKILDQICDKINMESRERKSFLSQVKGRLDYFLPRNLLKSIAEILEKMGFTCYTASELRLLYEKEAREFIIPILLEQGFIFIDKDPKKIGGFNIDIYASSESKRANRVPKAFGEVTITHRKRIKAKVEKFASWLHQIKGREYRPDLGDFPFFICPSNRLTKGSKEILDSNTITYYEFDSSLINEINQLGKEPEPIKVEKPSKIPSSPSITSTITTRSHKEPTPAKGKPILGKRKHTFKLQDIPGIGPSKGKLLKKANITTIEELISCNPRIIAGKIKGLGTKSLNKWIQKAKQIIHP